jgi:transposase InsO family protein
MVWRTVVEQRHELVMLAAQGEMSFAELCERLRFSRQAGYKWLRRYREEGVAGLHDRSRRPLHSPRQTPESLEEQVLALRERWPTWGGRKLHKRLQAMGVADPPSPSGITAILRRHGQLDADRSARQRRLWQRFEREAPNRLWQRDFKAGVRLHHGTSQVWTALDDYSRYAVGLAACDDQRGETVQRCLIEAFRRYGLPDRILCDNGAPWGSDAAHPYTWLSVWLLRLPVAVSHGRPYHPQTQGKDERFHGTLKADVLSRQTFADGPDLQRGLDRYGYEYNFLRPHDGIGLATPASRYTPSLRPYPEVLPPIEYASGDSVRRVQAGGWFSFGGREFLVSKAFRGQPIALRPALEDGVYEVRFGHQRIALVDLKCNLTLHGGTIDHVH